MNKTKKFHYAWIILIGMSIIMGVSRGGLNNAGGLFLSPVSNDLGIGIGSLSVYLSIASIATMIFLPIAGKVIAKYDIRSVLIIAIILQGGSFAAFGFMNSVWGWYIFAIPMAIGAVFTTNLAGPILINKWFKKNNGLALGLMMAAVGLFGIFIQPYAGNIIGTFGWRRAYLTLGLAAIAIIIPVVLLTIRKNPEDKGLLPYGMLEVSDEQSSEKTVIDKGVSYTDAKTSKSFYSMLLFLFFMTAIASFAQHIGPYAVGVGYSIEFSGQVLGMYMGGMFVGALIFGFLTDKIGARTTSYLSMIIGIISLLLLILIPENKMLFSLGIGLFGIVASSVGTLAPLLTLTIFGNKAYSVNAIIAGTLPIPNTGNINPNKARLGIV